MPVLGQNQYGKAETRVVRVARAGERHELTDLTVSVALSGDMTDAHLVGSNAAVLPTDTVKNTVYVLARERGIDSPESFAAELARHFVDAQPTVRGAVVDVAEHRWERLGDHSFARAGQDTRTARVTFDGRALQVLSGLTGLTVLNTTDSEFHGFVRDAYTTLAETTDRVLATEVTARWRHTAEEPAAVAAADWNADHAAARERLLAAFAGTYSYSLQQTLFAMGSAVIEQLPGVAEIRLSLPNKHHFLVDLSPFGVANETGDGAVYHAADRPFGLIEATVLREGAEQRIPVELTRL
ncbi:urate oxidase [Streptomyces sp. 3MP-14]|uniref:Uricase n=1 Tax=Streptomyces mimosae TaxID=2586635 RepID=A0A5N6AI99_9ACTN|nr:MULTISPECIES: urate oxidase [Streptomyces]KAB8167783.1 urate oxidase [Streptomyces mimosae]KAB8177569.1 urate oxidase [Streptomyces sp. 3MP-14]